MLFKKEAKSLDECRKLIAKYEHGNGSSVEHEKRPTTNTTNTTNTANSRSYDRLSFAGFVKYMNDPSQFLCKLENTERVYQNMNLPLSCYFVNSSHNT